MKSFLHKRIKRFELDGVIYDDSTIPRLKEQYIKLLHTKMRLEGYVPRFDIDPDFSIHYNGNTYEFILSVYGSYIGKRNASCIEGLDKNRAIFIPQNKSEESSQAQV